MGGDSAATMMKNWREWAWFNFIRLFQWHRILGVSALCGAAYFLVFFVFAKTDVSWFLPPRDMVRFHWPDLPHFATWRENSPDGKAAEVIYTVPTRQISAAELAQLPATNQTVAPATSAR
jgi:hypothetical protein